MKHPSYIPAPGEIKLLKGKRLLKVGRNKGPAKPAKKVAGIGRHKKLGRLPLLPAQGYHIGVVCTGSRRL